MVDNLDLFMSLRYVKFVILLKKYQINTPVWSVNAPINRTGKFVLPFDKYKF